MITFNMDWKSLLEIYFLHRRNNFSREEKKATNRQNSKTKKNLKSNKIIKTLKY